MALIRRGLLAAVIITSLSVPLVAPADPVETNPFGALTMNVMQLPNGQTPGRAVLTINNAARSGDTIYFGFRIMGGEDIEMTGFRLPTGASCTVSDFAGRNTSGGWQGTPVFGAGQDQAGTSLNSHMRMIGGWLRPGTVADGGCGNLTVDISFRATPLVAFYGAFFGKTAAPWHNNYSSAPWSVAPTGGQASYQNWWNLWGTFDTLGYSNACTFVGTSPGAASCG